MSVLHIAEIKFIKSIPFNRQPVEYLRKVSLEQNAIGVSINNLIIPFANIQYILLEDEKPIAKKA